jgi:hypothetical protein
MKTKYFLTSVLIVSLFFAFQTVHAQITGAQTTGPTTGSQILGPATGAQTTGPTTGSGGTLQNPLNAPDLQHLLAEILGYISMIGGVIILPLMLVFVGFQFVMAQGNPEKVSQARSTLLWTAVGGLLLLGASAIATVISTTAGAL